MPRTWALMLLKNSEQITMLRIRDTDFIFNYKTRVNEDLSKFKNIFKIKILF